MDSSDVYQLCRLILKFTPVGKFDDSVVTLFSGKTSELAHLSSLFVKKLQIRFFKNVDDFFK